MSRPAVFESVAPFASRKRAPRSAARSSTRRRRRSAVSCCCSSAAPQRSAIPSPGTTCVSRSRPLWVMASRKQSSKPAHTLENAADAKTGTRRNEASMSAVFDIPAIASNFPDLAETMLIDTRLTDEPEASSRVFRVYTDVPPHYHATCDEYLLRRDGPCHLRDGRQGACRGGSRPAGLLQERRRPRHYADRRRAAGVPVCRHAAARSEGHHLRKSRRWHTGHVRRNTSSLLTPRLAWRPRDLSPRCLHTDARNGIPCVYTIRLLLPTSVPGQSPSSGRATQGVLEGELVVSSVILPSLGRPVSLWIQTGRRMRDCGTGI